MDNPQRPEVDPKFVAALLAEDELGVVVRSHIFVEANLNRYIELVAARPEQLKDLGLRYSQKVVLACALGLDPQYKSALRELGRIRNAFAHKLDSNLTPELVARFYSTFPEPGKQAVRQSYERTKTQLRTDGKLTVESLPPREQFILMTLSLERLLMAAVILVTNAQRAA